MNEMAAIGDVTTGTLIARELDAPAAAQHDAHGACANCGTTLVGPHCHACGQSGHVHRTLGAIGHEIAHGVFHFEGKIWRTLPLLVFRPGELTRRYIAGERVRFVAPLALFLFTIFLMFAIVSTSPMGQWGDTAAIAPAVQMADVGDKLADERKDAATELARLQRDLTRERADSTPEAKRIAYLQRRIVEVNEASRSLAQAQRFLPSGGKAKGQSAVEIDTGTWLDTRYKKAKANPDLLLYKLKTSAYKFSWALIPLSTPFVAMLFLWRRRFGLYDHAIFVTYSLCFMSLGVILLSLASMVGVPDDVLGTLLLVVPPVHLFVQLRGAYGLRKRSALWRTVLLLSFAVTILVLFTLGLIVSGVIG